MQTTNHNMTNNHSNNITNNSQATKCNHSPLLGRGVGGEAVGGEAVEASIRSMTRKELAQLAGVSERTLRRWLHSNHNQLIAAGYQASQRKLPPRVVKYLMEFYGIER